jgi:hypothetical protein
MSDVNRERAKELVYQYLVDRVQRHPNSDGNLENAIAAALASAEQRGRDAVAGMVYETPPGEFSPDGWTWKQAFIAEKARRIEAEAAIETLHEKYAQERMSRSRQTISDNTNLNAGDEIIKGLTGLRDALAAKEKP